MIKPRHHVEQSPAEHAAEVDRVQQMQAATHPDHQPWAASSVVAGRDCPVCGEVIESVSTEPLDFEVRDGVLVATNVVQVVLPCGHSAIRGAGG